MERLKPVSLVVVFVVSCLVHQTVSETFCKDNRHPDGSYRYPGRCSSYYVCRNSATFVYQCSTGLVFDFENLHTCVEPAIAAPCVSLSDNSTDLCDHYRWGLGNHPLPDTCAKYAHCTNSGTYTVYCALGQLFETELAECVNSNLATPCTDAPANNETTPSGNETYCSDYRWKDGIHPHPKTCRNYIICFNNKTYIAHCDTGLFFDDRFGTCVDSQLAEPCNDGPRENGTLAQQCSNYTVGDILFILDSSSSIGFEDYKLQLDFVANVTKAFITGPDKVQFSAIVFSHVARSAFRFNDYHDATDLEEAIRNMEYMGATTYTDRALSLAETVFTSGTYGARPGVKRVAIVLTDGESTEGDKTLLEAQKLRNASVSILGIAIGKFDRTELEGIAGSNKSVYMAESYKVIQNLTEAISIAICNEASNKSCERAYADIIIAMDSSSSISYNDYRRQLDFVANITREFAIGPNDVRFGALVFGSTVEPLFDLGAYNYENGIEQSIRNAPYLSSSTDTAAALEHIRVFDKFGVAAGGRQGAVKILITLTDGLSLNPDRTREAATQLKNLGYHMLSVGIGDKVNQVELRTLASNKSNVFQVDSFQALNKQLHEEVITRTCQITSGGNLPDYSHFCREQNIMNGIYRYPGDCTLFIRCWALDTIIEPCPHGQAFNPASSSCQNDENARLCQGIGQLPGQTTVQTYLDVSEHCRRSNYRDGIHSHPYSCEVYLQCVDFVTHFLICPNNTLFDPTPRGCVSSSIARPCNDASGQSYDIYSACEKFHLLNGFYPDPIRCSNFIECDFGVTHYYECPEGLHYNVQAGACDLRDLVDCSYNFKFIFN